MIKYLQKNILYIVVFVTGACVLTVEIVALRMLSPFYGNTIYTVSSVISTILAALSLGYYLGGKYADKHPQELPFYGIIFLGGISVLWLLAVKIFYLPYAGYAFSVVSGPLIWSVLLFFIPSFLLGMLSPYAIRLVKDSHRHSGVGSISGQIFFFSTLGSIFGSLITGFVLIPFLGISEILLAVSFVLMGIGGIGLIAHGFSKTITGAVVFAMIVFIAAAYSMFYFQVEFKNIFSQDGVYEHLLIYDDSYNGEPARFFNQDRSSAGAVYLAEERRDELVYEYTKFYSIYKLFLDKMDRALFLGAGIYSMPRALLRELPKTDIDVVDIEPDLKELSLEYFFLEDSPRLHSFTEDGRRFLKDSNKKYDYIFIDVFQSLYSIPTHFTTVEFFSLARSKLERDGIVIINMIGDLSHKRNSIAPAIFRTFVEVFPNTYVFAVESPTTLDVQNLIIVGYNSDKKIDIKKAVFTLRDDDFLKTIPNKQVELSRFSLLKHYLLSDNHAPVDYLVSILLKKNTEKLEDGFRGTLALDRIDDQLALGARYPGSNGHDLLTDMLLAEMRAHTDKAILQRFLFTFRNGEAHTLANIIGRYHPERERRIILGAHYDTKRFADQDDGTRVKLPVPGANDGASGVAVLLEIARVLKSNPEYIPKDIGIDIVFFDAEEGDEWREKGESYSPIGSTYFTSVIKSIYPTKNPEQAIIIDMVCDKNLSISKEIFSIRYAEKYVQKFWDIAINNYPENFKDELKYAVIDDHTPLNEHDIPTFLLIDFDYPYWHTTEDTIDKCSEKSLDAVGTSVLEYLKSL